MLSTTGFSSQAQTAALLIWVMTHEIISSKRSVANDYFLLIDWNPIIFLMLLVSRKLCPSGTKKNYTESQIGGMLNTFHWDKPNCLATQNIILSLSILSLAPTCALIHLFHLFRFCCGRSSVRSCPSLSGIFFSVSSLHVANQFSSSPGEKQGLSVLEIDDGKTKTAAVEAASHSHIWDESPLP